MRFTEDDERFMRLALSRAQLSLEEGEIPVGCVLADRDGKVLALTRNRVEKTGDVSAHAELLALRAVKRHALRGATLYVTLEPCPMCAGAIALSGVQRVVFGAYDRKYGCCGSVYRVTEDPAFDSFCPADGGLMEDQCRSLLEECFRRMRSRNR